MSRVVKEKTVRRKEILDQAQRLIYAKGYEQMTIQDILDELGISKGAFYHHFSSKQSLLQALVERMSDEGKQVFIPIVEDPNLSALSKLQQMFEAIGAWKTAQKTYHLALLRVWYADENAVVRWKLRELRIRQIGPLFAAVVRQGVAEGVIASAHADGESQVLLALVQDFVDALAALFLSVKPAQDQLPEMMALAAAYTDALERVLGIPRGSVFLVDAVTLEEWVRAFGNSDTPAETNTSNDLERKPTWQR